MGSSYSKPTEYRENESKEMNKDSEQDAMSKDAKQMVGEDHIDALVLSLGRTLIVSTGSQQSDDDILSLQSPSVLLRRQLSTGKLFEVEDLYQRKDFGCSESQQCLTLNPDVVKRRLYEYLRHGYLDLVKAAFRVLGPTASHNIKFSNGLTPLHIAAIHGHLDIVRCLVETEQVDTNVTDSGGRSAFDWAILCEQRDVAILLLESLKESQLGLIAEGSCASSIDTMIQHCTPLETTDKHTSPSPTTVEWKFVANECNICDQCPLNPLLMNSPRLCPVDHLAEIIEEDTPQVPETIVNQTVDCEHDDCDAEVVTASERDSSVLSIQIPELLPPTGSLVSPLRQVVASRKSLTPTKRHRVSAKSTHPATASELSTTPSRPLVLSTRTPILQTIHSSSSNKVVEQSHLSNSLSEDSPPPNSSQCQLIKPLTGAEQHGAYLSNRESSADTLPHTNAKKKKSWRKKFSSFIRHSFTTSKQA